MWTDDSQSGLLKPKSKRQCTIILHVSYEKVYIRKIVLIFKLGWKTGDFCNEMNSQNGKLLNEKLSKFTRKIWSTSWPNATVGS